ncbi:MAG: helix-turn-helix domain-containing protein [Opitutae bacterium]|nr:helix-turn-helix domain-containing protein [Opitutae bacterium]
MTTQPDLLRLHEVAEYLRLSEKTVRRLIASGELPRLKVRGLILVRRSDLRAFLIKCAA